MPDDLHPWAQFNVLRHLAGGKSPREAATITGFDEAAVDALGKRHGYPDRVKLQQAAQQLADEINERVVAMPTPKQRRQGQPQSAERQQDTSGFNLLIATARTSQRAAVTTLAEKILSDCEKLRATLAADAAAERARQAEAAEKRTTRNQIASLQRRLAAARERLAQARNTTEVACTACGHVVANTQGLHLHKLRHCPAREEAPT